MSTFISCNNIFTSTAQVLVNPVNTVGVMGKGLALQIKQKYPDVYKAYKKACIQNQLTVGKLQLVPIEDNKFILNFPTKIHWKNKSDYSYITLGLDKLVKCYKSKNITSIAFPKIGCGCGGLNWTLVKSLIIKHLQNTDLTVYLPE